MVVRPNPVYLLWIIGLLLLTCPLLGQSFSFAWNNDGQATAIRVKHQGKFDRSEVVVKLAASDQPIFGEIDVIPGGFTFSPMVPLTPGMQYDVYLKDSILTRCRVADRDAMTYIKAIYPTADTLPENLLKIYLEFSQPMGEGYSENYLIVTSGLDTMHQVFLPLQPELWDTTHTRLTLWLDPGRIKRDLGPNTLWGAPLTRDKQYSILISNVWKDRLGRPLVDDFSKSFHVSEADRKRPSLEDWSIAVPKTNSMDPLILDLRESMDYSLLQECIRIYQASKEIPVSIKISHQESMVYLHPNEKWQPGSYHLKVASRLEDLAGNNLNRLFDRDVINDNEEPNDRAYHMLTFHIQ